MAIRPLSAFSEASLANLVEPRLGDSIESAATAISFEILLPLRIRELQARLS